jgi:hypothetical protein
VNQNGNQYSPGSTRCRLDVHALGPSEAADGVGYFMAPSREKIKGSDAGVGLLIYRHTALLISSTRIYESVTPSVTLRWSKCGTRSAYHFDLLRKFFTLRNHFIDWLIGLKSSEKSLESVSLSPILYYGTKILKNIKFKSLHSFFTTSESR